MATTLDSPATETAENLTDQSCQSEFWRRGAPADILSERQWTLWSRHLQKRRNPKPLATLCGACESPLRWGIALSRLTPQAVELLALADRLQPNGKGKSRFNAASAVQAISVWLRGSRALPQTAEFAVECLAVAHLLPAVAGEASEKLWWQVADALWQVAQSASSWRAEADMPPELALAQQLLAGELPLTLAYLFPEIKPLYRLRETSSEALSEGLLELTNGEGLLRGPCLRILRPLLASWTRAQILGQTFKKGCCSAKAAEQFSYLVTQSLALSAPSGGALLGTPNDGRWEPEFLATVVRLVGSMDAAAAKRMFPKKLTRQLIGKSSNHNPLTSDNCEWSGVAVMRAEWTPPAPTLAVDYSAVPVRMELWTEAERVMAGVWQGETTVDGRRLEPVGAWENTCWVTDKDCDYLELSLDLTEGARLDRQILLGRDDPILYLNDNVHLVGEGNIAHRLRLPLEPSLQFAPEEETREGVLRGGKLAARVLPIGLPEWRTDPRVGQLTVADGHLQLDMQRQGRNLSCPLFIDLTRSRVKKPCTWRQLTVAESLQIVPHDVAVGYRVQCAKQQWLFYRSLGKPANRTVLGQNLSTEFLAARFLAPEGKIKELVEIEA